MHKIGHNRRWSNVRNYFLLSIIILLFISIWGRVYYLQIIKHDYFTHEAGKQYSYISDFYDRGNIFFTYKNGDSISVASVRDGYELAVSPKDITRKDAEALYKQLTDMGFKMDYTQYLKRVSKRDDPYELILPKITKDQAKEVKKREYSGLILKPHRWRYYPFNETASQTIGFVANTGNELKGVYGLERYYEDLLSRKDSGLGVNFFTELFGGVSSFLNGDLFDQSGSIVTTLEPEVQKELDNIVKETYDKWSSKRVSAIVYDPRNGEILAMSTYPNFNLNKFYEYQASVFRNPLVENIYEMGSIIKAVTMAIGLDSGSINENMTYNDTGRAEYNGSVISNYDGRARGVVKVQEILSQSLNVGAAWIYKQVGRELFREYFEKFGLREETGIDLPNEAMNLTDNLESVRDIEYVTASFGQGIALTPIATVRALGALGTGYIQQPHLVKSIRLDSGLEKKKDYSDYAVEVLKPSTVETISRMLVEVVDTALDKGRRKKNRFTVAAKTGTAQIANPKGGYYDDKYNHTFFGYFPAFDPRFVVLLINEQPQNAKYASQTLTDPFYKIVDFLLNYYNIQPDR